VKEKNGREREQGMRESRLTFGDRYKGMAATSTATARTPTRGSTLTPQSTGTGFSQMGGRPPANESSGAAMSVLLSWHEKVVDVAGLGCVGRCMTDWRKV